MNTIDRLREKADKLEAHPSINLQDTVLLLRQAANEMQKMQDRLIEYSWYKYPDKSGGAFTQDEIDRARDGW